MKFWAQLADHLDTGRPAFLALVADNTRHSPGTRGARMFVRPDGSQVGTIGGGVMEANVIEHATEALDGAGPLARIETLQHRRDATAGTPSGLICAGMQTMVYARVAPDYADLFHRVAQFAEDDLPGVFTITPETIEFREEEASHSLPHIRLTETPDGRFSYEERTLHYRRVAIVGSGHCGLALSRTMSQLGYWVTVFERRPDVYTFRENEFADERIVVSDYIEVGPRIRFPELTCLVVMTADYPSDVRALLGAVDGPFPYKGLMGSAAKLQAIRAELGEAGIDSANLARLFAPIGLAIGSDTPEEIAISVAAQILKVREEDSPTP